MYSRHQRKFQVLYAVSDFALILVAFQAAFVLRAHLPLENVFDILPPVRVLLIAFAAASNIVLSVALQIYGQVEHLSPLRIVTRTFRHVILTMVGMIVLEFGLRLNLSRPFFFFFGLNQWILLAAGRLLVRRYARSWRRRFNLPIHVMVAGTGNTALEVARELEASTTYGIRLQGFFALNGVSPTPSTLMVSREYPVHSIHRLRDFLEHQVLDEIIFAVDSGDLTPLHDVFLECDEEGIRTRIAVTQFPHVNSEVYLESLGPIPLLTFSATPHDELRLLAKRTIDIVIAALTLLVTAPVLLVAALLVRVSSPGPVIFRQERCGLNGRRFTLYKFRSMVQNAEELRPALEHLNEKSTVFKMANDPRLTPVGRFLRKFSIDEFPQFWNVLRGDMSVVGPRPPIESEVENYARWQRRRLRMRPGLTCLWALEGRDNVDFDTMMRKDLDYIDSWSLALDFHIILRTIPLVISGKGAH
ncbi:MAG: sugar transferase [Bryobacterales bacterium]|nr:sugar transferase [Bryobacterales bacterium]